ncbi:CpaF family protein [Parasphingorhabdus halotolerans]|uniref:CpaF family protein n=1 Tax=Parasphingorhabdus halotolerans TaxID=2725558 RepID=A0A6H2DLX9_9SPHN|nr:CpaF family protein [Parasphingorhabdus halotolerans]QJB68993.1 CpaF family protein [Parasphingorhabdus halotolerans]
MSAFGKKNGLGGNRPSFGVAKPMNGGGSKGSDNSETDNKHGSEGGEQFPPIDSVPLPGEQQKADNPSPKESDAMARLSERSQPLAEAGDKDEGFGASVHKIKEQVLPRLLERVDPEAAATLNKEELTEEFRPIIMEVLTELKLTLNRREQFALEKVLVDELLGFGPLEELLQNPDISDIMVNGPEQTYIEIKGKLEIAPIQFRDEEHLFQIAQRIVNMVGRRVDQTTPLADARLADGSRVNVIVPPLSLKGTAISIRKFSEKPITLDMMQGFGSMSVQMCTALKIAGACRFNVVISGGTGSGKTTMLNAMSKMIDPGERVLTIEDAAELRLQQPHWLPLETRPPNLEGEGAITIGDLVKNALRMRPDRIILGEIRGAECFDLLAAMNTGHDGSMCTLHANSPRECLGRMENMILMGDIKIPKEAISRQIAESVDLIVQVKRLRDGSRRTTNITEVIGMEGDVIVTQELFKYQYIDEDADGKIIGEYQSAGLRPYTLDKARQYGFDQPLLEACL